MDGGRLAYTSVVSSRAYGEPGTTDERQLCRCICDVSLVPAYGRCGIYSIPLCEWRTALEQPEPPASGIRPGKPSSVSPHSLELLDLPPPQGQATPHPVTGPPLCWVGGQTQRGPRLSDRCCRP
eukprot:GHVU01040417.1.p4 GENE.GHVU01040417.1~~GHVU01040417.1.p4  ORF type:complete len:124 (+),score=3.52 GHVU01040417.1:1419-1790(+)